MQQNNEKKCEAQKLFLSRRTAKRYIFYQLELLNDKGETIELLGLWTGRDRRKAILCAELEASYREIELVLSKGTKDEK